MTPPAPHFEVYLSKRIGRRQKWFWRLVAGNGKIVAVSEPYSTKESADRGAEDARSVASRAVDVRLVDGR